MKMKINQNNDFQTKLKSLSLSLCLSLSLSLSLSISTAAPDNIYTWQRINDDVLVGPFGNWIKSTSFVWLP